MQDSLVSALTCGDGVTVDLPTDTVSGHVISIETYPQEQITGVVSFRHDTGVGRVSLFESTVLYVHLEKRDGTLTKAYQLDSAENIDIQQTPATAHEA